MADFLLIRGRDAARCLDALWVAAELAEVMGGAQIDVAAPEDCAACLKISDAVRRVIAVPPPDKSALAQLSLKKPEAQSWGGVFMDAAKKLTAAAGANARKYRAFAEELRIVRYDFVFDFDASAFSVAVARLAKSQKIIGFDDKSVKDAMPGAQLICNEVYPVKGDMSNSMRLRRLAARHFHYNTAPRDRQLRPFPPPPAPAPPYIAVGGDLPAPCLRALGESGAAVLNINDAAMTAEEILGAVQHAAAVFGNGVITAMAALAGVKTWFIGSEGETPEGATYMTTPAQLTEALRAALPAPAQSAPAKTPPPPAPPADGVKIAP